MMDSKSSSSGVPEGWKTKLFGEIAEFRNGLNFVKTDRGEKVKLIGVGDFQRHAKLPSTDNLGSVKVNGTVQPGDFLRDDDLLFVRSNGNKELVGRCLYIMVGDERVSFSGFTIRARVHDAEVLPEYIGNGFQSGLMRQQLLDAGGGTNISNLSQKTLAELTFAIPPLEEQRKIAAILSTWDETIEGQTRLLGLKRERKRGLMQQLLTGRVRFKEFEGLEWQPVPLSRVFKESRIPAEDELGKRLTVALHLRGISIRQERGHAEKGKTVYYRRKAGQFIYGKQNLQRGAIGLVPPELDGYLSSQDIPAFDIASDFSASFLFHLFSRQHFYESLDLIATGTGSKRIHPKELFSIVLSLPILSEQRKIAAVLSSADDELSTLTIQLAALKEQKRGLMQRLLTGKTRVTLN